LIFIVLTYQYDDAKISEKTSAAQAGGIFYFVSIKKALIKLNHREGRKVR
jgi:hypothetical protein